MQPFPTTREDVLFALTQLNAEDVGVAAPVEDLQRRLVLACYHAALPFPACLNPEEVMAVYSSMNTSLFDEESQVAAMSQLAELSKDASNTRAVISTDGVRRILTAMRTHPASAGLQAMACGVLVNIACEDSGVRAIVAGGGIHLILAALNTHFSDDCQDPGLQALVNLGLYNRAVSKAMLESAADERALWAMSNHPSLPHVQSAGSSVLLCLVQWADMTPMYQHIRTVLNGMSAHPLEKSVQKNGCLFLKFAGKRVITFLQLSEVAAVLFAAKNAHPKLLCLVESVFGCL